MASEASRQQPVVSGDRVGRQRAFQASIAGSRVYLPWAVHRGKLAPNNSFKPNLLRYGNGVAEETCHAVACTAQVGLTRALGLMGDIMAFSPQEREALLSVKGVGPTVIQRLEQIGFSSLRDLAVADAVEIVTSASGLVGSTCWKNSPQARSAIQAAIDLAISRQ